MSTVLAIDTSTPACSAALHHSGDVSHCYALEDRSHTRLLLPQIDLLLTQNELSVSDLDAIFLTTGPGSFTGLRIGMGLVQGFCHGADVLVQGFSSLALLAATYAQNTANLGAAIATLYDARMGDVYLGIYRVTENGVVSELADQLLSVTEAANQLTRFAPKHAIGEGVSCLPNEVVAARDVVDANRYPDARFLFALQSPEDLRHCQPITEVGLNYFRGADAWRKHEKRVS